MLNSKLMLKVLVGALALVIGCGGPEVDVIKDDLSVPLRPLGGVIGANHMSPADFWQPSTQSALRSLGGGALTGADGSLVATPLLDTAGGRSVLDYTAKCALPPGTSVASASGVTFPGSFGLAPQWTTRGLTTSEQRWVTACLLQHLNGLDISVDIMLEGSHAALDPRAGEDISDFTVKNATMFGNVFVNTLVKAYACVELDLQLACPLDLSLHALERICGASLTCGATVLGLCDLVCTYDGNDDPSCRTMPLLGASYPQAIRTKVRDTDLLELSPGCDVL